MNFWIVLFVLKVVVVNTVGQELALSCKDHPAYQSGWRSPLIRSYALLPRPTQFIRATYLVGHKDHDYVRVSDGNVNVYAGLDLFYASQGQTSDVVAHVYFQRAAKVYMFVGVKKSTYEFNQNAVARLQGWKSEGWAMLPDDRENEQLEFGVYQKATTMMYSHVQVFSREVQESIVVPSETWIRRNIVAPFNVDGRFVLRVAERNGAAWQPGAKFEGEFIEPNGRCPDQLHETWMVTDPYANEDADTRGVKFTSWHPLWDPCFWCTYDHEHGSSAKHLMRYEPKFTYTAFKNDREMETDEGFKGFVFQEGPFSVYYMLHAQTSRLRRVKEDYHTIAMAVTETRTGKLMMEIQHKGDFGFLAVRGRQREFVPIDADGVKQEQEQLAEGKGRKLRSINIVNLQKLDPRYKYRDADPKQGVYESWQTVPICSDPGKFTGILVDFRNPITGVKTRDRLDEQVNLGRFALRNDATSRRMRPNLHFGAQFCKFKNSDEAVSGVFYTNANGDELMDGPGKDAVRQFISPGFEITMTRNVEVVELGLGMHKAGMNGMFVDPDYGVDPDKN